MVPITDDEVMIMRATRDRQLTAVLTTLYFVVESGRKQITKGADGTIREAIGMVMIQALCKLPNMNSFQLL